MVVCFVFLLAGFPLVLDVFRAWAPQALVNAIASLSFLTHFESISKGVIDVRDLLYFAMLIAFFLHRHEHHARCAQGRVEPEPKIMLTKRSTLGGGALLALALLFIGLTVALRLPAARLAARPHGERALHHRARHGEDPQGASKSRSTSISSSARRRPAPYPELKTYGTRVREFLQELAARSSGKLRLQIIDPEPFSEDEDRAAELGVRAMPSRTAGGPQLYFGLAATNSTDGRAAIEFFDPSKEEFLEYDVVKLIYQLAHPKKPVVGWISGIPMTPDVRSAVGPRSRRAARWSTRRRSSCSTYGR